MNHLALAMKSPLFRTPYPRPLFLSDPGNDFTFEELERIVNTPNPELGWSEFRDLFAVGLPAGSYEESVYFLPLAIEYMCSGKEGAFEFFSSVIHFVSDHAEQLSDDQLLIPVQNAFQECFEKWTSTFRVQHYDREACKRMGSGLYYCDLVENADFVCELIWELISFKTLAHWADVMVESLASRHSDPIKSAWFLHCILQMRRGDYEAEREILVTLNADQPLIEYHGGIVLEHLVPSEASPTYWEEVFASFRM